MAIKNLKDFRGFKDRKSQRNAERGVKLEEQVEKLLAKLQEEEKIMRFTRNAHNSPEDAAGKDFTVVFSVEGAEIERSFGVTISLKHWNYSKSMHRDLPQLCWPIGTNPETMEKAILELKARK